MLKLKIRILILFMFVSLYGNSQINWFMMVQALGQDSIPITNANGFGEWKPMSALEITESQIKDLAHTVDTYLSEEQVEDYVGGMVMGNTETGITVTYQDADGTLDFVTVDQSATNEIQTISGGDGITSTPSGNNYTLSITDNTIDEAMLKVGGSVTDEYYLSYEASTGGFEWQNPTGSTPTLDAVLTAGASSNLAFESGDITINGDATPNLILSGTSNLISLNNSSYTNWRIGNGSTGLDIYPTTVGNTFKIGAVPSGTDDRFEYTPNTAILRLYNTSGVEKLEFDADNLDLEIATDGGTAGEVLRKDASNVLGWGSPIVSYAQGYTAAEQSVTSTGTYVTLDIASVDFEAGDVNLNAATDGFTLATAGIYEVTWSCYVSYDSAITQANILIYKNASATNIQPVRARIETTSSPTPMSQTGLVNASASDVIYLKASESGQDFNLTGLTISVKKL